MQNQGFHWWFPPLVILAGLLVVLNWVLKLGGM